MATRYNKLAESYCAMVNLASWIIEIRSTQGTAKAPVYKPSDKFPAYKTQLALSLAQRHDSGSFLRLQNGIFSLNVHRP